MKYEYAAKMYADPFQVKLRKYFSKLEALLGCYTV
jgi:hypothetical protein